MQVSTLLALMQDFKVDMLLLDLRDEEAYMQFHLKGGELLLHQLAVCIAPARVVAYQCSCTLTPQWHSVSQPTVCCSCELSHSLVVPAVQSLHH